MNEIYMKCLSPTSLDRRQTGADGQRDGQRDRHAVGSGVNVSVDDGVAGGNMQIICAFCVQLPH